MFKKYHEDFPKAPETTSYLIAVSHFIEDSTWWKTYAKYYEKIVVYPQGTILYTARADTTVDLFDSLQPAGDAGGSHRVFVSGCPWPVAISYRDIHTIPEVDPVLLLSCFRFGHADCRRGRHHGIDTFFEKEIPTGLSLP